MSSKYYIPNNLDHWQWPRHLNPYYAEVKAESAAWARSFGAFSPKAQHAYDRCDFNLLACLAYPLLNKGKRLSGRPRRVLLIVTSKTARALDATL